MERLSHDLSIALEESNCGRQGRKKFGLRRRARSTGNIPSACLGTGNEEASSSSPPQAAIISQVVSDSDDPQLNQLNHGSSKNRVSQFYPSGNFESDSFNENFSPAKPPNARRKRKFKKMAIDYPETCNGQSSPPILMGTSPHINVVPNCPLLNIQGTSPFTLITKKKRIFKHGCQDGYRSNMYCGKRKWSHRERSELGEMRERSFSGGCTSKSYYCGKNSSKSFLDFKNSKKYLPIDKVPKFKDKLVTPTKSVIVKSGLESALQNITLSSLAAKPSLPGSSSFNFIYRPPTMKHDDCSIFGKTYDVKTAPKIFTPPFFTSPENDTMKNQIAKSKKHDKSRKHKSHHRNNQTQLRNPLQFDDPNFDMDCMGNEVVSSSSISSSDSEGVVTNDSDREGDDELTDWPGNDEISSFNKNLNLKSQRPSTNGQSKANIQPIPKPKKDKFLPKQGLSSCKNKTEPTPQKTDDPTDIQLMDDDTMMSDSGTVLDTFAHGAAGSNVDSSTLVQTFTSFADVKNAGLLNNNVNEAFYHSFNGFQSPSKSHMTKDNDQYTPRTNFSLQKTSSSDLNLSEKSPQSDHCYSEHSLCFGPPGIREIRAGCRRLRDERPGFAILSAANEQLSRFLQDSCQDELKLTCFSNDHEEREKLASLAKLYSLEMSVELGRPVLRKTSNTTQSIQVEHTRLHRQRLLSEFKRRCYGANCTVDQIFPSLDVRHPNHDANRQSIRLVDSNVSGPSSASGPKYPQEPFATLAKAPTLNDLSQSQDYDQGFSEPSLANTPPLDGNDELKSHCKSDGGFSSDAS